MQTYEILDGPPKTIHCLLCSSLSTAPVDVAKKYCPWCLRLHVHAIDDARLMLERAVMVARPDPAPPARYELIERFLEVLDPKGGAR